MTERPCPFKSSVLQLLSLLAVHRLALLIDDSLCMKAVECVSVLAMALKLPLHKLMLLLQLLMLLEEGVLVGI